jgi:undecaprenyl-diphosphatase
MLQPLALPPATRARAAAAGGLLEDLRTQVMQTTGAEGLELEELERIKPRTVLIVVASTLAFYSLLPQLANLQATFDAFASAQPAWIVAALLASGFTYLFAGVSFQGAVADPLPFVPNLRAQLAASFAGLVGPAGAGGLALTARFLQRVGVRPAEAGASVAVKAVAGFAVHLTLLVAFVVWSGRSGLSGFSLPDSSTLLLVVAVALSLVGVLLAIRPVRRRLVAPLWASVKVGARQIGRVFRSPARVAALFGGSVGLSLAYVAAVFCAIEAFGGGLTLPQVGAAYLGAVALASFAPTPGGLGALESAMIAGFTGFGLDAGVAVSATLTFRLATFWLPILPGWAVLRWMERNDEL